MARWTVKLMKRALTLAALMLALNAGTAHATPFTIMVGDADWFGTGLSMPGGPGPWAAPIWTTLESVDRRTAGEAAATNGAQLTDLYSAIFFSDWCDAGDVLPGGGTNPDCSPNGSEGTFIVPFSGILQSATLTMLLGDFQCDLWFAITVTINGVNQPFCYSHGYQMAGLESLTLTPQMLAAANNDGEIRIRIQHNGNSLDYIAFDYIKVDGDTTPPVVPEPGTLALFGTGMVIVWGAARRRKRTQPAPGGPRP